MKEVASIADQLIVLLPIEVKLGQAQEQTSMFHIFSDDRCKQLKNGEFKVTYFDG
jgi:hypothetical protein